MFCDRTNKMHYIIHGFHHKHPMDGDRLVFPPLYTAAICLFVSTTETRRLSSCINKVY